MPWWGWCCCGPKSYVLVTHLPMTTSAGNGTASLLDASDGSVLWTLDFSGYVASGACIGPGGDLYIALETGVGVNTSFPKMRAYSYAGSNPPSEPVGAVARVAIDGTVAWTLVLPNQVINPYSDAGTYATAYANEGPNPYAGPMGHIVADTYDPDYVWFLGKSTAGGSNASDMVHKIDGSGSLVASIGSSLSGSQWFPSTRFRNGTFALPLSLKVNASSGNIIASFTQDGTIEYTRTGTFVSVTGGGGASCLYEGGLAHLTGGSYATSATGYRCPPGSSSPSLTGTITVSPVAYGASGTTAHADADGPAYLHRDDSAGAGAVYMAQSHVLSRTRADWGFVVRYDVTGTSEVWRSDLGLGAILPDPIGTTSIAWGFGRTFSFTV